MRKGDTSITGVDSLTGKKLCSVKGSTSTDVLLKTNPKINLQEYASATLCVDALRAGAVDAYTSDDAILAGFASQGANKGTLSVIGKPFSALEYGVGFKHDDVAFCKKVTAALQEFIDSGE